MQTIVTREKHTFSKMFTETKRSEFTGFQKVYNNNPKIWIVRLLYIISLICFNAVPPLKLSNPFLSTLVYQVSVPCHTASWHERTFDF